MAQPLPTTARFALALATLLVGASAARNEAPIDTGFQERVTVQLAQINFIAVDRSGRPVLDLRPDEIEIVDGKEKQSVAFLQPYFQPMPATSGAPIDPATPPSSQPEDPPALHAEAETTANFAASSSSTLALSSPIETMSPLPLMVASPSPSPMARQSPSGDHAISVATPPSAGKLQITDASAERQMTRSPAVLADATREELGWSATAVTTLIEE